MPKEYVQRQYHLICFTVHLSILFAAERKETNGLTRLALTMIFKKSEQQLNGESVDSGEVEREVIKRETERGTRAIQKRQRARSINKFWLFPMRNWPGACDRAAAAPATKVASDSGPEAARVFWRLINAGPIPTAPGGAGTRAF